MTKRQLILSLIIIIVSIPVIIGCFALANTGPFKINGFQMISEITKQTAEALWALIVLFATLFWHMVTQSWLSVFTAIGIIILVFLYALYNREG